jgi:hypothetical protein
MANMKKRKGDVSLQYSVISIAMIVVAALMILLAVWFMGKALSSTQSLGQKQTFSNLITALKNADSSDYYDASDNPTSGKVSGQVLLSIDEGYRLYAFSSDIILTEKDKSPIKKPAVCEGSPCFCVCQAADCSTKKLVDCKIVNFQHAVTFAATPKMYDDLNLGKPYWSDFVYVAFSGKQGMGIFGNEWGIKTLHFQFDSTNKVLIFDDSGDFKQMKWYSCQLGEREAAKQFFTSGSFV